MTETTLHGLTFDVAGMSEQGPRAENQDAFSTELFAGSGLVALADGMGGEKSGRAAADTALEGLRENLPIRSVDEARRAIRGADQSVTRKAEGNPEAFGGMGAALAIMALAERGDGPGWIAAHVGDVRILSRSPDGLLRLETRDHTPAFSRWEAGEISIDEIPDSAGANRLQRAIGRGGEPDVTWIPAGPGWTWVIISDGVYKAMRLDELSAALSTGTAAEACEAIRRKVDERGADDNYTAVVVRALGGRAAIAPSTLPAEMTLESPATARTRSSAGAGIALALALLALVLAGAALWMARETSLSSARSAELAGLRTEVDSLKAVMSGDVVDPFGPTAPSQLPGGTNTPAPMAPAAGTPTPPATGTPR